MINPIRFKTSVLYSGILCVVLVCFSSYMFHMVRRILYSDMEDELRIRAEQIVGVGRPPSSGWNQHRFRQRTPVGHRDDHRFRGAGRNQVVENQVGASDIHPAGLSVSRSVQQIQHGKLRLSFFIPRWRVDVDAARGAERD